MSRYVLAIAFVLGVAALPASAPGDESLPRQSSSRSESLELPGLTAGCHICEWRPKLNQMPAPEQCGSDDAGAAKVGQFECGFSQDCQRECYFLRCGTM
jgi:hypothetical protein